MPFDAEITTESRDLIALERARAVALAEWANGDGSFYCIGQCIWQVAGTGAGGETIERLLGFETPGGMYAWNDAPERTQAEVLARFDAAIERLSQ